MIATLMVPLAGRSRTKRLARYALRFSATVDSLPFACGTTYPGLGRTAAPITATDFRFFVHDVRLVDGAGKEVTMTLQQDSLWQSNGVALLDFENGTGGCSNGNADLRDIVVGSAPAGEYTGVRFTVGVPFELNHRDLTQQPSPLSLSRMFWAWNSGYKFMRIDMKTDGGKSWVLHLGSTECQAEQVPHRRFQRGVNTPIARRWRSTTSTCRRTWSISTLRRCCVAPT
ncbi:MAG: metallo-mystery pair system four-Cys motif protein [Bacteroidales bacterium]|nr:metallo-mystery pair system four-Cys motif protein [Bacteroidales bacterium]